MPVPLESRSSSNNSSERISLRKIGLLPFILFFFLFLCQVCQGKELLDGSFKSIYFNDLHEPGIGKKPIEQSHTPHTFSGELSQYASLGDMALAIGEIANTKFHPSKNEIFRQIKIRIPQKASQAVEEILAGIDLLVVKYREKKIDVTFFSKTINRYYRNALETLNTINPESVDAGYDYLLKAIIHYNIREYNKAEKTLSKCLPYFQNKSVIFYTQALLHLVEGDILSAKSMLYKSIRADKHATSAYALLIQLLINGKQYETANTLAIRGVSNDQGNNYLMPFISGESCLINLKNSHCAIYFLKKALKNASLSHEKAECKFLLARSYLTLGKKQEADTWYSSSLEEVDGNIFMLNEYQNRWMDLHHDYAQIH